MCRQQLHAAPGAELEVQEQLSCRRMSVSVPLSLSLSVRPSVCLCLSQCAPVCVRYIFKPTTKRKRIDNEGNGLKP